MVSKTKHHFLKDGFQKLVQRWRNCIEVRGDFVKKKKNYAALKIIDVGIFLFYLIKISFSVHFLFKWRQNLSARPRKINSSFLLVLLKKHTVIKISKSIH